MKVYKFFKNILLTVHRYLKDRNDSSIATPDKNMTDITAADYDKLSEDEFQSLMAHSPASNSLTVEVVYITNAQQNILEVQLPNGANIEDGIVLSGLLEQCEDIDLKEHKVGIYGVIKALTDFVSDGDRIEVYRPVIAKT